MARTKKQREVTNKALAYLRVSTDRQDTSMELQEAQVRAYCTLKGLELVHVLYEPDVSGFKTKLSARPEGSKIAAMIKSEGVQHVIAIKLDRIFRNAADALVTAEKWDNQGVSLHILNVGGQAIDTGSTTGKMFFTMLAGFAEFERNMIVDRINAALAHKKSKGERMGNVPYGFMADKNVRNELGHTVTAAKLVENPAEMAVIERMKALRASGLSLRMVAASLNTEGYRSRRGTEWTISSVDDVLRNHPVRIAA